jgi:hypothetical protein
MVWYSQWFPAGGGTFGVAQWRQTSPAYARYHLQSLLNLDKDGDIVDLQRGHPRPQTPGVATDDLILPLEKLREAVEQYL